jgi:hypothetical protein
MAKTTVVRLFVGGLVAIATGIVLEAAVVIAALAGEVVTFGGDHWVDVEGGAFAWTLAGIACAGGLIIAAGAAAAVVSWVGAVINTARLEDKTWFVLLLALGLLSLGWLAMIAYVISGPDSTKNERIPNVPAVHA